jgi:hypothetical protein
MTGFSVDWLASRERADARARAPALVAMLGRLAPREIGHRRRSRLWLRGKSARDIGAARPTPYVPWPHSSERSYDVRAPRRRRGAPELVIGHVPLGKGKVYNLYDRLDERRDALARWERFVLSCGEGANPPHHRASSSRVERDHDGREDAQGG